MITWGCIVLLLLVIISIQCMHILHRRSPHSDTSVRHHHICMSDIISVGSEREELFVPGDPVPGQEDWMEDNELKDL